MTHPLDEWIYYLKNNKIRDDFTAQGMERAREVLAFDNLSEAEKKSYWHRVEDKRIRDGEIETAFTDGEIKGEAKGRVKGRAEGRAEGETETLERIVVESKRNGLSLDQIQSFTKFSIEQIIEILTRHNMVE